MEIPQELLAQPLSIFPLPTTVFYPKTFLPLHIFEPRYRQMVTEAWSEHPYIGMVLLKPGWEADYFGAPPVSAIGCAGRIEHLEELPEGKFNILLQGLCRFRIVSEIPGKPFRRAAIEILGDINDRRFDPEHPPFSLPLTKKFARYTSQLPEEKRGKIHLKPEEWTSLGQAVDKMAFFFEQPVDRKQAFLEEQDVIRRAEILDRLLDFQLDLMKVSRFQQDSQFDIRRN